MTEKPAEDALEDEYADRDDDPDAYAPEGPMSSDTHTVYDKYGEVEHTPHDDELEQEPDV